MKTKKPFSAEIEARLTVLAFDADTARKKAEAIAGRRFSDDIKADAVWTYAVTPQAENGSVD